MKLSLYKYRKKIDLIFPIIVIIITIIVGIFEQQKSEIYASYLIDITTLNNSFITLSIGVSSQNEKLMTETQTNLNDQMKKFNTRYQGVEEKIKKTEFVNLILNKIIILLSLLYIIFILYNRDNKALVQS